MSEQLEYITQGIYIYIYNLWLYHYSFLQSEMTEGKDSAKQPLIQTLN